ncbi:MAG TPA: YcnI family protein, partial [Pseudonocardiaceae bacterium]|nr:YcnI family protein [Pseudonocardiaceae bacterium]
MAIRRTLIRTTVAAGATGLLVLLGTGIASAHVTIVSPDQPTAGGDAQLVLRVPNEDDTASYSKVELDFPQNTPLSNASPATLPGWTATVNQVNLKTPVKMASDTVTQAVSSIVWTANPGAGIPANDFQTFSFWTEGLPTNTDKLIFTAVQTYSNGKVVTWNQPTPPGGPDPDSPAPELDFVSTASATPAAPASTSGSDSLARWLGGAGLVVGVLGLGFGLGALTRSRKSAAGAATEPAKTPEETKA